MDAFFGVESCISTCDAVYNLDMDSSFCKRGCRLLMVIDFMDSSSDLNEVNNKCIMACHEAYSDTSNSTACQFGCQSQLPAAQRRQQQILDYEREQLMSRSHYYGRMVAAMLECVTRQLNARWSAFLPSPGGGTIIVGFESVESAASEPEGGMGMLVVVEGSEGESSTHKMASAQDEPSLAMSVLQRESQSLGSPRSLVFFVSLGVMVLIWYSLVIFATSGRTGTKYQKLSINGDLDYLRALDDEQLIQKLLPQEAAQQAPPLPIKIQINTV